MILCFRCHTISSHRRGITRINLMPSDMREPRFIWKYFTKFHQNFLKLCFFTVIQSPLNQQNDDDSILRVFVSWISIKVFPLKYRLYFYISYNQHHQYNGHLTTWITTHFKKTEFQHSDIPVITHVEPWVDWTMRLKCLHFYTQNIYYKLNKT